MSTLGIYHSVQRAAAAAALALHTYTYYTEIVCRECCARACGTTTNLAQKNEI